MVHYSQVEHITAEVVRGWAARFSQACVVLIGAGPPCQGVSGLNFDRKGALKDQRSCLFQEVPRIRDEVKRQFVWCPTYVLMESVASMDDRDREIMSSAIGCAPLQCDAGSFTWCHRPPAVLVRLGNYGKHGICLGRTRRWATCGFDAGWQSTAPRGGAFGVVQG